MTSIDYASKESRLYVKFTYGSQVERITNWETDLVFSGDAQTYTATPKLEVILPPNTGTLVELVGTIRLPNETAFTSRASDTYPIARLRLEIWEETLVPGGSTEVFKVFSGRVFERVRNPGGERSVVMFRIKPSKSFVRGVVGIQSSHLCPWVLGDANCGLTISSDSGTLTVISKNIVTITGLPGRAAGYFNRGTVGYQGLLISIRAWNGSTSFDLREEPPSSWAGATVAVTPGCDKSIGTCRTRWNNEANFGGWGIAVTSRNPLFEVR